MPLPTPQKSTASHFYKYSGPANLGWLKDILHKHEIYLPNLSQLNDDNDGLPRLALQSEHEMADFLCSKLSERNPNMSPEDLSTKKRSYVSTSGCTARPHCIRALFNFWTTN